MTDGAADAGLADRLFHGGAPAGDLLERAMTGARRAVGSHGIVGRCHRLRHVEGLPEVSVHVAVGPRRRPDGRRYAIDVTGTGTSIKPELSWLSAVAEALERYCFVSAHDPSDVIRAAYRDIAEDAVPLWRFGFHSEEQYRTIPGLRMAGADEPLDWAWAWSLTHRRFSLVPAALSHTTVGHRPPNNYLRNACSTGLATHVSVPAALLAGLYEVIERDALMIGWLHRRQPGRIIVDDDGLSELLGTTFGVPDIDFTLLDMTADAEIATVACLATCSDRRRPAAAFGSATRGSPAEASRKALFEAAQILSNCHALGWTAGMSMEVSEVKTLEDHARYYATAVAAEQTRFLLGSDERVLLSDLPTIGAGGPPEDLAMAVERLAGIGLEVLAVDLTTPDVASCGFHTFKVLVPGTVDINGDPRYPYLGSDRISRVPSALGWLGEVGQTLNLSPCPLS